MKKAKGTGRKVHARDYRPSAFYFRQELPDGYRYAAWTPRLSQLKSAYYEIVKSLTPYVQVLLVISPAGGAEEQDSYYGAVRKTEFIQKARKYEKYIFTDGEHVLCVLNASSKENIVLDDHGVLYIYSSRRKNIDILKKHGFERRPEVLIASRPHVHVSQVNSRKTADRIIKELKLQEE
jgi:hypothetical protein